MGLISEKSQGDYLFYLNREKVWYDYESDTIHYQDEEDNQLSFDLFDRCNRYVRVNDSFKDLFKIEPETIYTMDKLIKTDMYVPVKKKNPGDALALNMAADKARVLLLNLGYLNEFDREYLMSIGFTEDDLKKGVLDLNVDTRTKDVVAKSVLCGGAMYDGKNPSYPLWRLLLLDKNYIYKCQGFGDKTAEQLEQALEEEGFALRDSKSAKKVYPKIRETESNGIELPEDLDEKTLAKCNKIIASRESYIKKINEYTEKLEKADKKLQLTINKAKSNK